MAEKQNPQKFSKCRRISEKTEAASEPKETPRTSSDTLPVHSPETPAVTSARSSMDTSSDTSADTSGGTPAETQTESPAWDPDMPLDDIRVPVDEIAMEFSLYKLRISHKTARATAGQTRATWGVIDRLLWSTQRYESLVKTAQAAVTSAAKSPGTSAGTSAGTSEGTSAGNSEGTSAVASAGTSAGTSAKTSAGTLAGTSVKTSAITSAGTSTETPAKKSIQTTGERAILMETLFMKTIWILYKNTLANISAETSLLHPKDPTMLQRAESKTKELMNGIVKSWVKSIWADIPLNLMMLLSGDQLDAEVDAFTSMMVVLTLNLHELYNLDEIEYGDIEEDFKTVS